MIQLHVHKTSENTLHYFFKHYNIYMYLISSKFSSSIDKTFSYYKCWYNIYWYIYLLRREHERRHMVMYAVYPYFYISLYKPDSERDQHQLLDINLRTLGDGTFSFWGPVDTSPSPPVSVCLWKWPLVCCSVGA